MKLLYFIFIFMSSMGAYAQHTTFSGPKHYWGIRLGIPNVDITAGFALLPKLYLQLNTGIGVGSAYYEMYPYYFSPTNHKIDTYDFSIPTYIAAYMETELRKIFVLNKKREQSIYTNNMFMAIQWKTFLPLLYYTDLNYSVLRENYRVGLIMGFQKRMGKDSRWLFSSSAGLGVRFNYNLTTYNPAFLFNNKFIYLIPQN